jgi:hypothetical protein
MGDQGRKLSVCCLLIGDRAAVASRERGVPLLEHAVDQNSLNGKGDVDTCHQAAPGFDY